MFKAVRHRKSARAVVLLSLAHAAFSFAASVFALPAAKSLREFGRDAWQAENGLPQNSIRAIAQTKDGYIWFATESGLARFDGVRFGVFDKKNTPAIKNDDMRRLFADRQGALWAATPDALLYFSNNSFRFFTTADGLLDNEVLLFYQDRAGTIWMATRKGLCSFRYENLKGLDKAEGLSETEVVAMTEDEAGTLWAATAQNIYSFDGARFKRRTLPKTLNIGSLQTLAARKGGGVWLGGSEGVAFLFGSAPAPSPTHVEQVSSAANVSSLHEDRADELWAATSAGLMRRSMNGDVKFYGVKEGLPDSHIEILYEDREGSMWVGTGAGVCRFTGERIETFSIQEGLLSGATLAFLEDAEGDMWIANEGGVNVLKDRKFAAYTTREGLSADYVKAVYEDASGGLWIGTHGGGLNLLRDGKFKRYGTENELSSNIALALAGAGRADLWIGTPDGLNRLRGEKVKVYTSADGLPDDLVRSLGVDREGNLWVGTRRGLTRIAPDERFETFTALDGLAGDLVGDIIAASNGDLWIATLGGVSRLRAGKFASYTTKEGLSNNVVTALYEDRAAGAIWAATKGGGLHRLKDGRINAVTSRDGLASDVIYCILDDGRGNLWFGSDSGVFRASLKELNDFADGKTARVGVVAYDSSDGMPSRDCGGGGHPAGWRARDGKLWFATVKGLAAIDPAHIETNSLAPPVVIEGVTVDDRALDSFSESANNNSAENANSKIVLPPGGTRFEFRYTAPSFAAPQKVRFKYKLEGFDKDWVEGGTRRVAYYTNLPPGDYRFVVTACNNDGVWNASGAAISFHLKPHFYQTYLFYLLCAALLALVAWAAYQRRLRRVRSEFALVTAERTRIAREIHDTLAQSFTGISVQLELIARLMPVSLEASKAHLDQARQIVRQGLAEARSYVWDLRSQSEGAEDLPSALAEAARQLTGGAGDYAKASAHVRVSGMYRKLPPRIEENLLRIAREAVTNAVRHADARNIEINLNYAADRVFVSVRDDGKGFDTDLSRNGHFGLTGMRERIESVGGSLSIESRPGAGTEVKAEVPVRETI